MSETDASKLSRVRVLSVSATYGAGGSVIAPGVAKELGLDFFDRLIHGDETRNVDSIMERLTREERDQAPPGRIVSGLSSLSSTIGLPVLGVDDLDPRGQLRRQVQTSVSRVASDAGGVILGRAAAVVLGSHPTAFNVRLHGPSDRCLRQGAAIEGVTEAVARQHQTDSDRSWGRFVTRLFDRDPSDSKLYHLVLDTTVLPLDASIALISGAARAFWKQAGLPD
ncbi:MAG: cytidylate kinase-like family protein [Ilumatobacteraceae bacterium]